MKVVANVIHILKKLECWFVQREAMEGKKSSVHVYMMEYPDASERNAVAKLQEMVDISMQMLWKEVLETTMLPRACKQLHLHAGKVMHNYYCDSDAYSTSTKLLSTSINNILFTPISI